MPFLSQAYIASLDNEAYGKLLATTRQIGLHPQTHDPFLVSLQDLRAGTTILGSQGGGKTRLILSLIMQEILSNQPVIVIDPHGDLTQDCIAMLPDELPRKWRDKIYLLDMEDEQYPFGVNVFSGHSFTSSLALGQAINQVRHIFEVQWPEITRQQHLPKYLLACTIVLFANPGSTLVDMYRLLKDDRYRQQMLKSVSDPTVLEFWRSYGEISPSLQAQQVEPLINRLLSLFMGRSLVRNIVGQPHNTINFRRAIENSGHLLVRGYT